MRKLIAWLVLFSLSSSLCFAGGGPDQKQVEKVRKQVSKYLEKGRMVSVETYDQHQLWGAINEADPDRFVLTVAGAPTTLRYSEVKRIKAPMDRGVRNRIVMGLVLGGLAGITLIAASQDR